MNVLKLTIIMGIALAITGCRSEKDASRITELEVQLSIAESKAVRRKAKIARLEQQLGSYRAKALKWETAYRLCEKEKGALEVGAKTVDTSSTPPSRLNNDHAIAAVETDDLPPAERAIAPVEKIENVMTEPAGLPEVVIYDGFVERPPSNSPCEWVGRFDSFLGRDGPPFSPKGFWDLPSEARLSTVRRCWPRDERWTWTSIRDEAVSRFQSETSYNSSRVHVAYGLLQTGNNRIFDTSPDMNHDFRRQTLPLIYRSSRLRRAVYDWAMPKVTAAFAEMDAKDQDIYLSILRQARAYIYSDQPEKDLLWWQELNQGKCDWGKEKWQAAENEYWWKGFANGRHLCTSNFAQMSPPGWKTKYRKVEAWMWRRIYFDGMGKEVLQHYVTRAIHDLEAARKKAS